MTINPKNASLSERPLQHALKSKSRHRREELAALATASPAPRLIRNDLVPKLALIECAPADLVVPARNVRKIEAPHLREVATAISSLGFCDPVLIDERNTVLDGVVRVEAAKLLSLPHIPCIRAEHLNPSEHRLVRIALNRLSEKGSWNLDELKLELEELILEDAPIEITGFSMPEIDQIVIGEEPAAVETGPLEPEPDAKPIDPQIRRAGGEECQTAFWDGL
jgi:ParB-like chromosome segregation protein Spo0J